MPQTNGIWSVEELNVWLPKVTQLAMSWAVMETIVSVSVLSTEFLSSQVGVEQFAWFGKLKKRIAFRKWWNAIHNSTFSTYEICFQLWSLLMWWNFSCSFLVQGNISLSNLFILFLFVLLLALLPVKQELTAYALGCKSLSLYWQIIHSLEELVGCRIIQCCFFLLFSGSRTFRFVMDVKSRDGTWCLGQCHKCGKLSLDLYSFGLFPPAWRREGRKRDQDTASISDFLRLTAFLYLYFRTYLLTPLDQVWWITGL